MSNQAELELILKLRDEATGKLQQTGVAVDQLSDKQKKAAETVQNLADRYGLASRQSAILDQELQKLQQDTNASATAVAKKQLAVDRVNLSMQQMEQRAQRAAQAMRDEAKAETDSASASDGLVSKMGAVAKGYIGIEAARQTWQFGKEGAALEGIIESFDKLAQKSGTTSDALLASMKKASNGTISEAELMQKANTAVLLGGDRLSKDLPSLLEVARASAKATGKDINEMFDSLVVGLSRNSKMIIDNLGITVDVGKANEDYAASIGKTVSALSDQEKALAFQAAVMKQGKQMVLDVGVAADSTADKLARAEANITNFLDGLKVGVGQFLGDMMDGLAFADAIFNGKGTVASRLNEVDGAALTSKKTWQQYKAQLDAVGQSEGQLSEAQYRTAQALHANGMEAQAAMNAVRGLGDNEAVLRDALFTRGAAAEMSSEQTNALIDRTLMLSAANPELSATIAETIDLMSNGGMSASEYSVWLDQLAEAQLGAADSAGDWGTAEEIAAGQAQQASDIAVAHADSILFLTDALLMNADANYQMSDAQFTATTESMNQQLAAAQSELQYLTLTNVMAGVQAGNYDVADAQVILAQQLGVTDQKAQQLILTFLRLQQAQAQLGAAKAGSAAALAVNIANAQAEAGTLARTPVARGGGAGRAPRRSGGDGRASGGTRASDADRAAKAAEKAREKEEKAAEKSQEKLEKSREQFHSKLQSLEQKHTAKLQQITDDYYAKALAAEKQFNSNKFDQQADFYTKVANTNRAHRAEMLQRDREAWDIAQKMAQEGKAKEAEAYYKAAQEEIAADADRAEAMREIREKLADDTAELSAAERDDLEEQLRLLQEADRLKDEQAAQRLENLQNANDSLKQERDEALAEENASFADAQGKLRDEFARSVEQIVGKQQEQLDAQLRWADEAIAAYGRVAAAAGSAAAGSGEAASGEGSGSTPEGSYALGTGDAGLPRDMIVQAHAGEIIATPRQSDRIRAAGGLDYVMKLAELERVRTPRDQSRPSINTTASSTLTTVSSPITMAPGAIVINGTQLSYDQLDRLLTAKLDQFSQKTASSATQRTRMR